MEIIVNGRGDKREVGKPTNAPTFNSEVPKSKRVYDWIEKAKARAVDLKEGSTIANGQVDISLPAVALVSLLGDVHYGSPETDLNRFEREFDAILQNDHSYIVFMGDLVDGFFWGGAAQSEQSANMEEQFQFLQSLFKASKGKVLLGVSGEHDSKWASKSGMDPYSNFSELTGAPYVRGIAEVNLHVGEQDYKVTVQHAAKGNSLYNNSHPGMRNSVFNLQGADVYNSAHTHRKALNVQSIRTFGGESHEVIFGVVGPYKRTDEFAQRKGYVPAGDSEMGGYTLLFHADQKKIEPELDITFAHKKWG